MLSLPNKNFQPILFTYPFQSLAIVRIRFEAENLSPYKYT